MTISQIHQQAVTAAQAASREAFQQRGGQDGFPCGFAWVTVYGVKLNTREGREFKALGFRKAYSGGIELWNPGRHGAQNVDVKEAGARAYADVLRASGYQAYAGSRLD
jgi:hypothetical protein